MNHPHTETSQAAFTKFKELADNLNGWEFAQEKQGVKLYSRQSESGPIAVRGDYEIQDSTFTIDQIMAIASSAGARKIWDDKFDCYELKTIYDSSNILFWAKVKTPWPVSPRDMCCIVSRIYTSDINYAVMASVEDEQVPEIPGNVRAHLHISGWKVQKLETGVIQVTYITQIDLKGSIPSAFLKNIQIQVPLCAGQVVAYAAKYGYPPYVVQAHHVRFESEDFCHETKGFKSVVKGTENGALVEFDISKTMYLQGLQVKLSGGDAKYTVKENRVVVYDINGVVTVEIN